MATLLFEGLTAAEISRQEAKKTSDDRWRELTTAPSSFFGVLATVAGGVVLMGAAGDGAKAPAFLLGAVGGNFLYNSLIDDVPGVVDDVGAVAVASPLNPYGADEVGLTPQQIYEDATVYHTRGTPQVGTRPIRPPL